MARTGYYRNPYVSDATSSCCPDSKQAWMELARSYKFLPKSEVRRLIIQAQDHGDQDAAQKVISSHLLLLTDRAGHIASSEASFMDLIGEGYLTLERAVRGFDRSAGVEFITYAQGCIDKDLIRKKLKFYRLIRIPEHAHRRNLAVTNVSEQILADTNRQPTSKTIATVLGLSEKQITDIVETDRTTSNPISLDEPLNDSSDEEMLVDFTQGEELCPLAQATSNLNARTIFELIEHSSKLCAIRKEILKRLLLEGEKLSIVMNSLVKTTGKKRQRLYVLKDSAFRILAQILREKGLVY